MAKKDKEKIQASIDNGAYGKPLQHDRNFLGPRTKRSCTDIICLLLFVVFIVAWIVVGVIALTQGNPLKHVAPYDSNGKQCGVDPGYEDYKYLYYFDLSTCFRENKKCDTPQVCVESCPSDAFFYNGDTILLGTAEEAIKYKICHHGKEPQNKEELEKYIEEGYCASWYIPIRSFARRCIVVKTADIEDKVNETLGAIVNWDDLLQGSNAAQAIAQARSVGETIISELGKNWPYLVAGFAIAMACCFIYILIMRWFAWIIVWFSLFGVLGLFAYCTYISWTNYQDVKNSSESFDVTDIESVLSLKVTWMIFFIASIIVMVVVLLMIIFLRNRIRIAVALIGEGSRAVGSIKSTLFFPLVPWIFQLGVIAWTIAVWIHVSSSTVAVFKISGDNEPFQCESNEYTKLGEECEPDIFNEKCQDALANNVTCSFEGYKDRAYIDWFHAINIIGFFWVLCFISDFSDMALAGSFSTWYWTFKKSDVPFFTLTQSIGRTTRYHLGTLAFGSLILALCKLIRAVLEFIKAQLSKYHNGFVKAVLCCMSCFFWCLEKFIKFINRNAYIMCAIHGKNFCRSAHKSFNLVMRNILRFFVLDKVTDFLFLLGKLTITAAMVILSIHIFSTKINVDDDEMPEYTYYLLPVIIVAIGTYFVTSIFFSVYAMAVDTLFLCFLEDIERNDGSAEKPYYMSKRLLKILGKNNKKYKERLE